MSMDAQLKFEDSPHTSNSNAPPDSSESTPSAKGKTKNKEKDGGTATKRRCVSTACIACRRRKSKCDGNLPKCAACASVYLTECEYAPHTDHRRKGVYKKDIDSLKTKNSTLQTLIQAILNYEEEDVPELVRQIRTCDNLEELAESVIAKEKGLVDSLYPPDSPVYGNSDGSEVPKFEAELSGRMGDLLLDGAVKFIGGTSNLIWLPHDSEYQEAIHSPLVGREVIKPREEAILSWTNVTQDKEIILHFMNMYFCWHYSYFTTLSKELFYRDFLQGTPSQYCSALLVNVMLALGCHFSSRPSARADPDDSSTTGDHFFDEAKRLLYQNDEFANTKLCTVQAMALMSVREAGCGRESKGWVYSGVSFRMACDLGLNVDAPPMTEMSKLKDEDVDARRITFWGCFLFDKCWSNYLGRQPQLQVGNITTKKPDVFASEDSEMWSPFTDSGIVHAHAQPARTRAVALQISRLAEISSDLLTSFYHPNLIDKPLGKQAELKKLSDLHTRLEAWKRDLPTEMEPREGQLPQVLVMHMFFQLLYIHLYRPFLKYTRSTSPLPIHVSPRKFCTQAAGAISKLFRLYKRTHGLRQICNISVYIAHSACTIHLLNLPDKNAKRDIVHGVKHLEEIGECWTCARRTLRILSLCAEKWNIELPEEASASFSRTRARWGSTEPSESPMSATLFGAPNPVVAQPAAASIPSSIQPMQHMQGHVSRESMAFSNEMFHSPASTIDTRRSSGGMSLPPQSAADLSRGAGQKIRPSIQLTQAQQDAWNAHTARRHHNTSAVSRASSSGTVQGTNAQQFFGGVDSLVEDNQDWWLKDQNSLALGFENWTDADWSTLGLGSTNGMPQTTGGGMGYSSFTMSNDNGGGGMGMGSYPYSGNLHLPNLKMNGGGNANGVGIGIGVGARGGGGHGHKRMNSFDDMYY